MDLFDNELVKAKENEEDVNELNEVTFGDASAVYEDWEWEKDHEKMAEVFSGGIKQMQMGRDLNYVHFDEGSEMDESDLKDKLNQLVIEDDEDEEFVGKDVSPRKAIDLEELFGPASPPGLFPADELVTGVPNIWGSPARESRIVEESGIKSLLQTLQQTPAHERFHPVTVQPNQAVFPEVRKALPHNAKTLEEIEQELIRGSVMKTCWKVEEVEKALTAEDAEWLVKSGPSPGRSMNGHMTNPAAGSPVSPSPVNLPSNIPHSFMRFPLVNQLIPTMPGVIPLSRSPFPIHGFSRSGAPPLAILSPMTGSNAMAHMIPQRHPPQNNLNYYLAQNAAAGFGVPQRRQMLQRMPGYHHHHHTSMHHLQNLNRNNEQIKLMSGQQSSNQHGPASTINPHYLLQQQQHFQQQQMRYQPSTGYQNRFMWSHGMPEHPMMMPPNTTERKEESVDEYAGLMQPREKEWIIKIQLLQLHTDNPYIDDYYFTCWSIKKMLREKQKQEGIVEKDQSQEPTLVLPQLAKVETKAYTPVQFEGSLGRLTASSIHSPRQIIDLHLATTGDHEEGHHLERKRFKQLLLEIEKGYDILLDIDDIEKKALAQPPELKTALYGERKTRIHTLYQRLCSLVTEANGMTAKSGLLSLISIHKGLMLAVRLLPLLEKEDAQMFCSSLLRKLPLVMKKEWQEQDWPRFYQAVSQVIHTADLENLLRFSAEIIEDSTSKNRLNSIMSVMQNKLGLSLVLTLVSQGEVIYSTISPVNLDIEEQRKWRTFIELVASALENLNKDMLEHPVESPTNITNHFVRFLDKKQLMVIEDKLEMILS